MRKIKFRLWSGTKMFYDLENVMKCLIQQMAFDAKLTYPIPYDHIGLHKSEFMQFIGLKDKNGKEIYEGDIVNGACFNGSYAFGKIVYWKDTFVIEPIGKFIEGIADIYNTMHHIEIIGNIYENPEIIK